MNAFKIISKSRLNVNYVNYNYCFVNSYLSLVQIMMTNTIIINIVMYIIPNIYLYSISNIEPIVTNFVLRHLITIYQIPTYYCVGSTHMYSRCTARFFNLFLLYNIVNLFIFLIRYQKKKK